MFLLRPAKRSDLPLVLELAHHLASVNLPPREDFLCERLHRSEESFGGLGPPSSEREYQFVLEDAEGRVVGTCAILSKHGTPEMPHYYLEVGEEERYARSIDVRARHVTLRLGRSTDGPTELGSLVLHPDARGQPGSPGKLLSWGRFAFIALHPECFEDRLIAEMRASFDPRGKNLFWESFGKRFTGLSYEEADSRSAVDKSFIRELFPESKIYASLLDPEVAQELGQVHDETRPAVGLLEQAGFHWNGEIDPFDAGPFYGARTRDVVPIQETCEARIVAGEPGGEVSPRIVSSGRGRDFQAVVAPVEREESRVRVPKDPRKRLGSNEGDSVALTPLPRRRGDGVGRG